MTGWATLVLMAVLIAGAAIIFFYAVRSSKQAGAAEAEANEARADVQAMADAAAKIDAGRKAGVLTKADLAKGKTPAEIVRGNDSKW